MNESDTPHTHADISEQLSALQRQAFTLLLALIVVSGTLVVFLYYQSHILSKDIANLKAQPVIQWVAQNQPGVEKFKTELVNYSKTHPEFLPVLQKYGYTPTNKTPVAPKK